MEPFVTFRLDDITPDMNWDKFNQIESIFNKYGVAPLLGVVPQNLDPLLHYQEENSKFWEKVIQLQKKGWSLSQHGYQHVYDTEDKGLLKLNPFSEFAGVEKSNQLKKILGGKKILEEKGIYTDIFMAPGHSYDINTLKVLKSTGFRYITDGFSSRPYRWEGIIFLPCAGSSWKIYKGFNTICIHPSILKDKELEELDYFISTNKKYIHSFHELFNASRVNNRNCLIKLDEFIKIKKYLIKVKIGQSSVFNKYMECTNLKNIILKNIFRVIALPYLLVLYFKGRNK